MKQPVPKVAVPRLTVYLQCLEDLPHGVTRVSSEELAARAGVNSAKVRKDLSYLGSYGVRGVGYDAAHLRFQIRRELGLTREWPLVIVGVGNLGRALANYGGFAQRNFRVAGVFDDDPNKVGTRVGEHRVEPLAALAAAVVERGARIGVITTPAEAAQRVADLLAGAGVASILNFAPTVVRVPAHVQVRRVDFSTELQVLAFHLHQASMGPAGGDPSPDLPS
ncbi:MAG: redox-sensing transcriptional repressor Rex [Actinobacteria bacterium]|nr:redox-sensing transcriptional repressor Rex [Actinomycetota bacterium]